MDVSNGEERERERERWWRVTRDGERGGERRREEEERRDEIKERETKISSLPYSLGTYDDDGLRHATIKPPIQFKEKA